MSRLNLDQFKETVKNEKNVKDLEKLTGGILGACHKTDKAMDQGVKNLNQTIDKILNTPIGR
ncbi:MULTISPECIES: hypothetical protein [Elizabethkingia]|uniref:hypothetical protein n=1 Tax=Elizabethkingia TaxID=308865 RepID=UPI001371FEAA|nr:MULTISPECIES: hypothetical protein [Elizabethkingia]MCL1680624.1 hypothetical protein [Elizabethkingia miricola]MCT3661332.1 hypothetical protein [Elizabethkingia anophelis]MDV3926425.1 hypothetical protein [Elizabethkingia anophelis]MDV4025298.1 hypothetical protein [Elizabethkingia anophelis]MYY48656.1 hypothetical protein [Elizabethkingia anophelis]